MKLIMKPYDFACHLEMCEPGFFVAEKQLCFKSEYTRPDGSPEAYNSAGEAYHGDPDNLVIPVNPVWIQEET